jgi:hypothetical protein
VPEGLSSDEIVDLYRQSIGIGIGALVGTGARDAAGQVSTFRWIGTDALVEARGHIGPLLLHAGGGPRLLALFQTLVRDDAERLRLGGYETDRTFRGLAAGAHVRAGVRVPLASRIWCDLDLEGDLLAVRLAESTVGAWSAGVGLGAGVSF